MGLQMSSRDMEQGSAVLDVKAGSMKTLFVYGNKANLMVATRSPGYHSHPHRHDCEQLNYLADGELWIFIENEGYHLRSGDFLRIPSNAVHWAWNCGTTPSVLIEVHAPVLDPSARRGTVGLFANGEVPSVERSPATERVDFDWETVEHRVLHQEGIA